MQCVVFSNSAVAPLRLARCFGRVPNTRISFEHVAFTCTRSASVQFFSAPLASALFDNLLTCVLSFSNFYVRPSNDVRSLRLRYVNRSCKIGSNV